MQADLLNAQAQPLMKLTQSNLELMTRYATSPDVLAEANSVISEIVQRSGEATLKLMQSGAYAQLVQGLMKNYTEFLMDMGRSSVSLIGQGGLAFAQQMQHAAESATSQVIDAADVRGRRARQAA